MTRPDRFLLLSAMVNLPLVCALVLLLLQRPHNDNEKEVREIGSSASLPKSITAPELGIEAKPVEDQRDGRTWNFDWESIESDDWFQYVENLRRICLPEPLLVRLVTKEIESCYDSEISDVERGFRIWSTGADRVRQTRSHRKVTNEVKLQKLELIQDLLHVYSSRFGEEQWLEDDEYSLIYGALAPEKPIQVITLIFEKYGLLAKEVRRLAQGILIDEDYETLGNLYTQMKRELTQIVAAPEIEEFILRRHFVHNLQDDLHIKGANLGGSQLREITKLSLELRNPFKERLFGRFDASTNKDRELRRELLDLMGSVLEEEAADRVKRVQRRGVRTLVSFAERKGLPYDVALEAIGIQDAATAVANQLREDLSLPRPQRTRLLAKVQRESESSLRALFEPAVYAEYVGRYGAWLDDLDVSD